MAKAWTFENEYWDVTTGENVHWKLLINETYEKKLLKTEIKYNGRTNIKKRIYAIRFTGKQTTIW